jgi:hypothetical protein
MEKTHTIGLDFVVICNHWLKRVGETKDLKPLRKEPFKLQLEKIMSVMSDDDLKNRVILLATLPYLKEDITQSKAGARKIREDLWRRLLYIEMLLY